MAVGRIYIPFERVEKDDCGLVVIYESCQRALAE